MPENMRGKQKQKSGDQSRYQAVLAPRFKNKSLQVHEPGRSNKPRKGQGNGSFQEREVFSVHVQKREQKDGSIVQSSKESDRDAKDGSIRAVQDLLAPVHDTAHDRNSQVVLSRQVGGVKKSQERQEEKPRNNPPFRVRELQERHCRALQNSEGLVHACH